MRMLNGAVMDESEARLASMNAPTPDLLKQHVIDPEICIRCNTCEETCPIDAVTHDGNNYVVDASICNHCMDCISPCPTGSIDNWRVVAKPYSLEEQYSWNELPAQQELDAAESGAVEALEQEIEGLLEEARRGLGGKPVAPHSASKPTVNLYNRNKPATATVTGNFRLTHAEAESDVRHLILDFGDLPFPVLEGQSIGIVPPGTDAEGKPHLVRLYSVASSRDGEKPNAGNLALTVKREPDGLCSNYLCDLSRGAKVEVTGPFGATFLYPNDPAANIIMICTGTGSAPFRAFTERRRRDMPDAPGTAAVVLRRAPAGGTALFRAAAEGAGKAARQVFLLFTGAGTASDLCPGPHPRGSRHGGGAAEGPQHARLCLRAQGHGKRRQRSLCRCLPRRIGGLGRAPGSDARGWPLSRRDLLRPDRHVSDQMRGPNPANAL